jgi:hypothetical protein
LGKRSAHRLVSGHDFDRYNVVIDLLMHST